MNINQLADETWYEGFVKAYMEAGIKDRRKVLIRNIPTLQNWANQNPKNLTSLLDWVKNQPLGTIDRNDAGSLERIIANGEKAYAENKDQAARSRRSLKGRDYTLMTPSFTAEGNFSRSVASHPELAAQWSPKNPCKPEEMALSGNGAALFLCARCGTEWSSTIDNRTKAFRREGAGLRINCPSCNRQRKASLEATQSLLENYLKTLGQDPEAWESLPAGLRLMILNSTGGFSSNEDSFKNALLLGNLRGDYSITDILKAQDVEDFADKVKDADDASEDKTLTAVTLDQVAAGTQARRSTKPGAEQLSTALSAAGMADLVGEDAILVEHILQVSVEAMWEALYQNPEKEEELLAQVAAEGANARGSHRWQAAKQFWDEYQETKNLTLTGFTSEQTRRGEAIDMAPLLHQKRFAALVSKKRRVANWSGTGAGKTLAAALAANHIGSTDTLILCPKGVKPQWKVEFEASFPGMYDIRETLPQPGEDLERGPNGKPRVWLINYEDLSTNHKEKASRLAMLQNLVTMVVMDEAHCVKSTVPEGGSLRHGTVENFMEATSEANPDLAVVLQTATPVKTDLAEARSLLRLLHRVNSPLAKSLKTEPTARNASRAFVHLSTNAVRHHPEYDQELTRERLVVDVTGQLAQVAAKIKDLTGGERAVSPFVMARALFDAKAKALVERVKEVAAPVVVYTKAVTGVVSELEESLKAEGISCKVLNKELSANERADLIHDFEKGDFNVLIGSDTIGAGLDGLQRAASHMIVMDMPFTAADDAQLTGRMLRPGQRNNVTVDYLLAEAKFEDAVWSYCNDIRWNRLEFRRTFTEAAVDGVLPEGTLSTVASLDESRASAAALETMLERMREAVAREETQNRLEDTGHVVTLRQGVAGGTPLRAAG